MEVMTVKDVAAHFGVHPETLRRWERSGIIAPATRRRGRRIYHQADITRIEQTVLTYVGGNRTTEVCVESDQSPPAPYFDPRLPTGDHPHGG